MPTSKELAPLSEKGTPGSNTWAVSGALTVSAGTLKFGTSNTGTLAAADIAAGSSWDLGLGNQTVTGLTGAGTITRSGSLTTGADGAALISPKKEVSREERYASGGNGVAER